MTPLIQRWSRILPYPGDGAHWFDLGWVRGETESFDGSDERLMRLPYPRTLICVQDVRGGECALLLIAADKSVTVAVDVMDAAGEHTQVGPFVYFATPEGMRLHRIDGIPREAVLFYLALIQRLVAWLDAGPTDAYATMPVRGLTDRRRIANGKPPLRYDWYTVTVPATPKVAVATPDVAGQHASPRQHTRRGHWRNLRTGKRVWVRDCKVGDASRGVVDHDYRVRRPCTCHPDDTPPIPCAQMYALNECRLKASE